VVTHGFIAALAVHETLHGLQGWALSAYASDEVTALAGAFLPFGITIGMVLTAVEEASISEARLSRMWEASHDGLALLDAGGRFVRVNGALCRMLGHPREELERHSFDKVLANDGRAKWLAGFCESFASGRVPAESAVELDLDAGQHRWFECSASFLDTASRRLLLVTVRDVSERKLAEAAQARLDAQYRQAKKMEAIGTLAGGIAHDFNNILGAIGGFTELVLRDERVLPAQHRDHLREVLQATGRARDLVQQILTFSRQSECEFRPVRLGQLVSEACRFLRASIPATIAIDVDVETGADCTVMADPTQLHQVIMNLSANAAYEMRTTGGRLTFAVRRHQLSDAASGGALAPGRYARLSVSDTGPGISADVASRIFDPFFTTKPAGEGTGLGLSVVHGIVRGHRGSVEVVSQPGAGTTFEILLPMVEAEPAPVPPPESQRWPAGEGQQILVVDDEPSLVRLAEVLLGQLGYRVMTACDGVVALEQFRADPARFAAMLTDQTMPGLTGLDLAEQVRRVRPGFPIVLCTGYQDELSDARVRDLGINGVLAKPYTREELAASLAQALGAKV
jgi:PAS domain S-box-containing protein